MATEIKIQESVCLKKGEREENALTSESFEETVTELPGNKVSSQVSETVNTPLGTGKPTEESRTFSQSLSVPMVVADEHSNTPESHKAAKQTEPEENTIEHEENAIESVEGEVYAPEKTEHEVGSKLFDSVTSSQNGACEDIKGTTTDHATRVEDFKQDLSETREFVKEETEDKSVDAQEANAQCEIGPKDVKEQKAEESVMKIEQDEETEELKPDVEEEKREQIGLLQAITSDDCISTQTKSQVESTEHEQKDGDEAKEQDVNVLEKKDDSASEREVTFEGGLQEKNHHSEDNKHEVVKAKGSIEEDTDVFVSTQATLFEGSIKNEETISEKAIEKEVYEENGPNKTELEGGLEISDSMAPSQKETPNMLEKDQGNGDNVTSSQEASCADVEETSTLQHVTTVIDFKEQELNEKPREFIEEETKEKSLDAQKASKEGEKGAKEDIEQNPEESVTIIEKEDETEEIKPGVEIEEKKEKNELLPANTTDVCISTQTKSQVEKTEQEEEDKQNDVGLNEKSESMSIKEVCEETGSKKVECEEEVKHSAMTIMNKDENEDEEKEQAVNMLEKAEGEDDVTSSQDVTLEKDLQETHHHNEDDASRVVMAEESVKKTEQQMLIKSIPSNVCISTQTGPEEETTEKNDEEAEDKSVDAQKETGQYDDGANDEREQKLEESVDETAQSFSKDDQEEDAEEIKPSDEKIEEKNVCISEQIESQEEATKNEENATESDGDQKEKLDNPLVNEVCQKNDLKKTESKEERQLPDSSNVKNGESVDEDTEEVKSSDETKENMQQQDEIKTSEVQGVRDHVTSLQNASNEDIKETMMRQHDTTVAHAEEGQSVSATSKDILIKEAEDKSIDAEEISLELGQPNEQNVEETHPCLSKTTSENSEDETKKDIKYLSQGSVEDITDNTTKEEKCTSEHDPIEEHNGRHEVSKEKIIDLDETREVVTKEDITPSTSLETSKEDTSNSEKEKAESENLPIEDLESVSEVQNPELVPKSEESVLKEECVVLETETHLDEEKRTTEKEISSDEKTEHATEIKQQATNVYSSTQIETEKVTTENEEKNGENAKEYEENEIVSREENPEKKQEDVEETKMGEHAKTVEEGQSLGTVTKEVPGKEEEGDKSVVGQEQQDEIKTSEVQGVGDDVTSSQNASNEDIKETMMGQHDTTVAHAEEGQSVSATSKEILIKEAEDKSIVAEEISLELGQPNEQNVEETHLCPSKTTSENSEDETKKEDKDLSQESVEDMTDNTTKEEKCKSEHDPIEEHNGRHEVSKEKIIDLDETTEVVTKEDITPSTSLETSKEDTSNSEKEKAESENLPIEDLETVSEVQNPGLVPKSEESMLKEECVVLETETHLDEEKKTTEKEISSDEKTEQATEIKQEATNVYSSTQIETEEVTTENEEKNGENAKEYEENEIVSREENPEKKQEDVEETKMGEHATIVEEGQSLGTVTKEVPGKEEEGDKSVVGQEQQDEIKTSEVQGVGDDVTSSQNASNEDIKEIMMGQHDTTVAHAEEGQSVSAMSKEILIKEAEDKSIVAEEISLKLGQPNEQNVEETHPCLSKTTSENSEDETKKDVKDLSQGSVEDITDNTTKEEKCTSEHGPIEEHNGRHEVSKEKIIDLDETTEVATKEYITPSTSLKTSKEDTSNSENEKAESENLPIEDLESVSEVQNPELVPKSEESVLKEECVVLETETHLDEEKRTTEKEISSDEKTEQATEIKQEATNVYSITQIETEEVTTENEEKNGENAKEYDENETVSREENPEKIQEDVEETKMGEHATTVEEGQSLGTVTKEVPSKEEGDKSVAGQEEIQKYDDGENNKPEEHADEIKPSVEANEEKGVCISTQIKTQEEATNKEEDCIESDSDREEKSDNLFVKEGCEENDLKKSKSEEERQLSDGYDVKTRESVDENIEETKSSYETKENKEQQGLKQAITADVCGSKQTEHTESEENNAEKTIENDDAQKEKPESPLVDVVCEATNSEIIESEEGVKHSDNFSTTPNKNETEGKEEKLEKENEIKTSEVQGGEDDVTSSQNASNEDIKETTIGQHDTTVAYVDEGQGVIAMPKEILIEEAEDKSIDAEEVSLELGQSNEQNVEETHPCLSKTISEKPEDETKKEDRDLSHEDVEDTSDNTTKEEKVTLERKPLEEHSGRDEVSKEKFTALNETTESEPQEDITPSTLLETSTEDTLNSGKENAESEKLPIVSEVHIPELVPKSEESVLKEECFISETEAHLDEKNGTLLKEILSDEKTEQRTETMQETVKEVCEETSTEKAELEEGIKQSDSSNTKINEKGMASIKDEDQEKDQEVNVSVESQGEDNITSSQNEVYEEKEDLQEKNYQNESNEHDIIKSRDDVNEDTEEAKSSVETEENTEHVITTDVCSSTLIESHEATIQNEENNGEKAIENDENETACEEENLEKKQDDVCSSVQTERKEETIENEETNEEAIENDDGQKNLEKQEKEQELEISELQGCGDDVISSQNTSNEGTKETTIDQHATTMVHFEEKPGVTAITKEIVEEEVEDKSVHSQEASEQSENGAKDETEQQPEESVNKPVNTCSETIEGSIKKEEADAGNKEIESELEAENQVVLTENVAKELGQLKEQKVEEIQTCPTETISEKTEDEITNKDGDLSNDSIEHVNGSIIKEEKSFPDGNTKEIKISTLEHEPVEQNESQYEVSKENFTELNETMAVEPQEDVTPSGSLGTSTEDTSNSDKAKANSENLPIEDLESVSEVHIPEVMPKLEDSKMKEECLISATTTYADEENGTATKETSSYENLETHGSTQQPENSYNTTEENAAQVEETGEINSIYENREMKEDVTQESQLNSTEGCSQMVKDVILTEEIDQVPSEIEKEKDTNDFEESTVEKDSNSPELEEKSAQYQKEIVHEISNSDSIPVENVEVTEVSVDGQLGQEDLQGKEDISCVSKATNDSVDQEPKEESILSLEDDTTAASQVNLSTTESTAHPSETEKLATQVLESDRDVQIPEVAANSEDSKVKEGCTVLEPDAYTDENNVEQDNTINEISSAPNKKQENVIEAPSLIEQKALIKENLEIHELKPTSEPVIEEDQVAIETKLQPEQLGIAYENITDDPTLESKLEHTSGKDLEDGKEDTEENVTLAPENEIKSIESQNEPTKNIILTDEVAVETEKRKEKNETEEQVLEEDNCPTELDNTPTPNQKELVDEIEYSKHIPVGNTEVTKVKAESQIDVKNIQAAEDPSCSSKAKASSIIQTSKVEMHEGTEQTITVIRELKDDSPNEASKDKTVPVAEDSKASELQLNSQLTKRDILEEKDDERKSELQSLSEDQRSISERCIEEEAQGNPGVETKDAKSENEAVEDVIKNEVLQEDEKAKESKSIKDIINEEAKLNQLTSDTDEVCQIKSSSSRPDVLEATDSVEDTVTEKEKETLDEPRVDDSAKTTYDSILSSTEIDVEARSEEIRGHGDTLKLEEKPTKDSEIATEVTEIEPECREASAISIDNKNAEDPQVLASVEKDVIDVQKHEKDPDHETKVIANVVSNVASSEIEPPHLDTKVSSEFINQEIQREQKKEADESIEAVIPVEDVKASTRELEVRSVDLEVPSIMDATADKAKNKKVEDGAHLKSSCDQNKPIKESSEIKQEPLELDAPGTLGTTATEDFKVSQKSVTDDLIEISQTHPEIQKYEDPTGTVYKQSPNEPHPKESTESTILTEKIESSQEQGDAKSLIPEAENANANKASGTEPQCSDTALIDQKEKSELVEPAKIYLADVLHKPAKGNLEVAENLIGERDSSLTKDQQPGKNEVGETGVKTDEEDDEEEDDNEPGEKMGSCADAPVMVESSKDMDVKAHKKSHNILSGVGSKVKHSIAKVKKAITGKTSPPKSPSPKAKNQVTG